MSAAVLAATPPAVVERLLAGLAEHAPRIFMLAHLLQPDDLDAFLRKVGELAADELDLEMLDRVARG